MLPFDSVMDGTETIAVLFFEIHFNCIKEPLDYFFVAFTTGKAESSLSTRIPGRIGNKLAALFKQKLSAPEISDFYSF